MSAVFTDRVFVICTADPEPKYLRRTPARNFIFTNNPGFAGQYDSAEEAENVRTDYLAKEDFSALLTVQLWTVTYERG